YHEKSKTKTLLLLISRYPFLSPSGELSLRKATYIPSYSPSSREFPSPHAVFSVFFLCLLEARSHPALHERPPLRGSPHHELPPSPGSHWKGHSSPQ
ncbi:unnamed protein product, partial [Rangifer tarandus platyrhynchus]